MPQPSIELPKLVVLVEDTNPFDENLLDKIDQLLTYSLKDQGQTTQALAQGLAILPVDFQRSEESMNKYLHHLWFKFLALSISVPADDPIHGRAVQTLVNLRHASAPPSWVESDESVRLWAGSQELWSALPQFRQTMKHFVAAAPLTPTFEESMKAFYGIPDLSSLGFTPPRTFCFRLDGEQWMRLNSFIARLTVALDQEDVKIIENFRRWLNYEALYALIEALEYTSTPEYINTILPAATAWIKYSGSYLRKVNDPSQMTRMQSFERHQRLPWCTGPLYYGPLGFVAERWDFWKDRFQTLSNDQALTEMTRQLARESWEDMVRIGDEVPAPISHVTVPGEGFNEPVEFD